MRSRRTDHSTLRVVRGVLLAVSSAVLTLSAHALADGGLPDAATTLLLAALIGWTATAFATKASGVLATMAVLGAGQLVMHLVLSTLATHSGASQGDAGVLNGWAMTAAHTGATIVTALLVARAESMLWAIAGAMRVLLPISWRAAPVPAAGTAPCPLQLTESGYLVSIVLRRVHGMRGPPDYS